MRLINPPNHIHHFHRCSSPNNYAKISIALALIVSMSSHYSASAQFFGGDDFNSLSITAQNWGNPSTSGPTPGYLRHLTGTTSLRFDNSPGVSDNFSSNFYYLPWAKNEGVSTADWWAEVDILLGGTNYSGSGRLNSGDIIELGMFVYSTNYTGSLSYGFQRYDLNGVHYDEIVATFIADGENDIIRTRPQPDISALGSYRLAIFYDESLNSLKVGFDNEGRYYWSTFDLSSWDVTDDVGFNIELYVYTYHGASTFSLWITSQLHKYWFDNFELDTDLPKIELTSTYIEWEQDAVAEGEVQHIEAKVLNDGYADSGSSHAKLYLSLDNDFDVSDDYLVGEVSVPALREGESATVSWDFKFPDLGTGSYDVWTIINVDSQNEIEETNEWELWKSNNSFQGVDSVTNAETWAGFSIRQDRWIDTLEWLGWVLKPSDAAWLYSALLKSWIYFPDPGESAGGWAYSPRGEADPTTMGPGSWGGLPLVDNVHVDTGKWLGWIYVPPASEWIYSYPLSLWIYFPDPGDSSGEWAFFTR